MAKLTALILLIASRFIIQPCEGQSAFTPPTPPAPPAKLMSFSASITNSKVFLQWMVNDNASADQFEVEKSVDGKNFTMAALVFATESPTTDNYYFYEKSTNKKFYYRIRLINKNRETEYSPIVEVGPKA